MSPKSGFSDKKVEHATNFKGWVKQSRCVGEEQVMNFSSVSRVCASNDNFKSHIIHPNTDGRLCRVMIVTLRA